MSHLLGTLHLPGQAEQQIVRDGVHQVQEGCVLIQDVVQRGAFQPQILRDQSTQMTSTFSPRLRGGWGGFGTILSSGSKRQVSVCVRGTPLHTDHLF